MSNSKQALETAPWLNVKPNVMDYIRDIFIWFNSNQDTIKQALENQAKIDDGAALCEWMPMDTAPRDGTPFLVAGGTVKWHPDGWFSYASQRVLQWDPTHWMPLPQPPTEPENKEENE